ncbi:uncharacterized protein [Chlorocebus sabaeus]|uniref:uncharacterized protein isoform X1 n=1 Tax=Chlorocebus sabaeus TaxID=60711 RepID=UPI003BF9433B
MLFNGANDVGNTLCPIGSWARTVDAAISIWLWRKCTVSGRSTAVFTVTSKSFTSTHQSLTDPPRATSSPESCIRGECPTQTQSLQSQSKDGLSWNLEPANPVGQPVILEVKGKKKKKRKISHKTSRRGRRWKLLCCAFSNVYFHKQMAKKASLSIWPDVFISEPCISHIEEIQHIHCMVDPACSHSRCANKHTCGKAVQFSVVKSCVIPRDGAKDIDDVNRQQDSDSTPLSARMMLSPYTTKCEMLPATSWP